MSGIMHMMLGNAPGAGGFAFTISSNQTNANLATLATAAGWDGTSALTATIASGVYISSNSTGTPALTVNGSFPGGVTLVNGGYIVGMGGAGGNSNQFDPASSGSAGGLALSVSSAISITNNGTIGGGGGGGGGGGRGGYLIGKGYVTAAGGGGGGGRSSNAANSSGGTVTQGSYGSNASGGSAGTVSSAGSGGTGGSATSYGTPQLGGNGGAGGGWGSSGSSGNSGQGNFSNLSGASGGSGGGAVSGNSNITWLATGTRLGSIT